MKRKIFKSDIEKLKKEGLEIMKESIDSRFYNRVAAVNAVLSGVSPTDAAPWFGMDRRSLGRWVKLVDESGFGALKDKPRPGAPAKLGGAQMKELDGFIQSEPRKHGFRVWDGPSVSALVAKKFGVTLSTRQSERILHKLGYALVRPQTYPSKNCEQTEKREAFQKKGPRSRKTRNRSPYIKTKFFSKRKPRQPRDGSRRGAGPR